MEKKISIKDVAKRVGVSIALVSYVLNNKEKQARVGKDMVEKIRQAAAELNYQPNLIAKGLKSGKTNTLGLIVADISNPFFSNIARIVEDEAKKHGYTVIFGSNDENAGKSKDLLDAFSKRQVDGLIISPAEADEQYILQLKKNNFPFVLIDRYFQLTDTNCVRINNFQAAYDATQHLIDNGYRKISMVAYDNTLPHMEERVRGYLAALKDAGIKPRKNWLAKARFQSITNDVVNLMENLLKPKREIDAFLFATNSLAVNGLKVINRLGIKVPSEVGIISFDESDVFDFFYSPITYVRQDLDGIAREAVNLLIEVMESKAAKVSQVVVEARLVVRESSAGRKPG